MIIKLGLKQILSLIKNKTYYRINDKLKNLY